MNVALIDVISDRRPHTAGAIRYYGHAVEEFGCGQDFLQHSGIWWDALVIDHTPGRLDGIQLLRRIRWDPRFMELRTIVISYDGQLAVEKVGGIFVEKHALHRTLPAGLEKVSLDLAAASAAEELMATA